MVKIRIYVEGGGDGKNGRDKMREGFSQFFENALGKQSITVIPCGSRETTLRGCKSKARSSAKRSEQSHNEKRVS